MILSVSRRTDIPSYYSEWLVKRFQEGYAMVRNPFNPKQIKTINLSRDNIDGIVFWTKNPEPMLTVLDFFMDYPFYFQFTLTPYSTDIEANLPDKQTIIQTFQKLSEKIGPSRVILRYDPILINARYPIAYHIEQFNKLLQQLNGYTEKVVISFIDHYKNINKSLEALGIGHIDWETKNILAKAMSQTAREYKILLESCAEDIDLTPFHIQPGRCIDPTLLGQIAGWPLSFPKDKNQRPACGCAQSIDIGAYNTCKNGCVYCYANHSQKSLLKNCNNHQLHSPFLIGSDD